MNSKRKIVRNGRDLLEYALLLRHALGNDAAIKTLALNGIPRDLAILAIVGRRYSAQFME